MNTYINGRRFDEERALYGSENVYLTDCAFDGPADGESALKECKSVSASRCFFNLRYPLWHDSGVIVTDSNMTELCRAALWYSDGITLKDTKMHGIKALRECRDILIEDCDIVSPEFGWSVSNIRMENTTAVSEYFMLRSENIAFSNVKFKGKYSFQYIKNAVFENCEFDTKDAFWHAENVKVRNSVVRGEYLAWYSDGVTFENCTIIGTQPLCWCKNLRLINCELLQADLCFEKSEVEAEITSPVISIKNPRSGRIAVPDVGEIIMDDKSAKGEIVISSPVT